MVSITSQRLKLLTALALAAALFLAPAVFAQNQFVAVVITGELPRYQQAHESFVKILRAGGLGEDKVQIYVQTPNPDPMSWANSIRKAVGVGADLIVTYGAPATLAAKKEARGVPVLFADVYDPVALGIVKTLAVPGGEISGVSGKTPLETLVKTLDEIKPVRKMGVLFTSSDKGSVHQVEELAKIAGKHGISLDKRDVARPQEIGKALTTLSGSDCLFISESAVVHLGIEEVLSYCKQQKIPSVSQIPGLSDMGALMTLEADPLEQGQLVGVHALQILSGQKAHTLPVRTPKKISLVINLQAAKELGITVPFQALSMATRVIK